MNTQKKVQVAGREAPVVAESDVIVVGGGPAGTAAAVSAARQGAKVTLLERYAMLGGMAAGGMVLVLDDMINGAEITVHGIVDEFVGRMHKRGLAVYPSEPERGLDPEMVRKWTRWGAFDFHQPGKPKPIVYAVAFDPEGWKYASNELVEETGVDLRLHSWYSAPIVEDGRIKGVISETKQGPQAVLGDVVIDTTGDADVAVSAGAPYNEDTYIVTTVFRLGGVDTDAAERFDVEEADASKAINRKAKQLLGGSWDLWWLKTPLPGVVWCNAPHMSGYTTTDPASLTDAQFEGRKRVAALLDYVREVYPGFENAFLVDIAPQMGVRQSRMIEGEYVVTKEDVKKRRHFADSVARGRDYYTPYRALVPKGIDGLLVAGRHYSATPDAQRISREIPPCMAMGEAAGVAAVKALDAGVSVRDVDVAAVQRQLRAQGADPGDIPSDNALIESDIQEVPA